MSTPKNVASTAATKKAPQKQETAVATTRALPVSTVDWSKSSATGFENVKAQDLGIPFLVLIQKGSPEIDTTHKLYPQKRIEGVQVGSIINTVTRDIVYHPGKDPLVVIPVAWQKFYVEWGAREKGGGFIKAHVNPDLLGTCKKNEKGQDVLPNGNILATTAYFHVLYNHSFDEMRQAVIGMTSTQLGKSRRWLNLATSIKVQLQDGRKITPPLFSHTYLLSTEPEQNAKGSWMGWKIACGDMLQDMELIEKAQQLNKDFSTREITADPTGGAEEDVPM